MLNREFPRGSRLSRLGLAGSLLAFATTGLYLLIMQWEGNNSTGEFAPWASMFALVAVVAAASSVVRDARVRALGFAATAGVSVALGLLGLMSIGILLLAVAALLIGAAQRATEDSPRPDRAAGEAVAAGIASFAAAIAVVIALL